MIVQKYERTLNCGSKRWVNWLEVYMRMLSVTLFLGSIITPPTHAQSIAPATDGTRTIVSPSGNVLQITGGQLSGDGGNLFHSFQRFGLESGQVADFLSSPKIRNILGRINGGEPSLIEGLLQVSGGNSNLFLMNPSGIIFGRTAQLNVLGSFTATTANGIGFNNLWFNAIGTNDYSNLIGSPTGLAWTLGNPGSIVNAGNLSVGTNQSLALLAGTVANTGTLSAPNGTVIAGSVQGNSWLRLRQPGSFLSFDIEPMPGGLQIQDGRLPIASLPQLLARHPGQNATGLTVNAQGVVEITGSGIQVNAGDVVSKNVTAQTALLTAINNLTLSESNLKTTGNLSLLAQDTVRIRDSVNTAFSAYAGGNLLVQGNRSIDIWALQHPIVPLISAGDLTLASNGKISGDAHFTSGGRFSILNLGGQPGEFVSLYDPIIRAVGDVTFGNYTGASLKVEATGSIIGGSITINAPDVGLVGLGDPDADLLRNGQTLILKAGVPSSGPRNDRPNEFSITNGGLLPGNIRVGNLKTTATLVGGGTSGTITPGPIILEATGSIEAGTVTTDNFGTSAQPLTIRARGDVTTQRLSSIITSPTGDGGDIFVEAGGKLTISSSVASFSNNQSGKITLKAQRDITFDCTNLAAACGIESFAGGTPNFIPTGSAGDISIISQSGKLTVLGIAANKSFINSSSYSEGTGSSAKVSVDAAQGINLGNGMITTISNNGNGSDIQLRTSGDITLGRIESSSVAGNSGKVTLESGGNITLSPVAGASGIDTSSGAGKAGEVTLLAPNGQIRVQDIQANGQTQGGQVILNGGQGIFTGGTITSTGGTQSGAITFSNPVNLVNTLVISAGNNGNVTFNSTVNGTQNLTISNGNIVEFKKDVSVNQIDITSRNLLLNGNLTTANTPITLNQPVTLTGPVTLNAGNSQVTIGSTLNAGNNSLTLKADNITLSGALSGSNILTLQPVSTGRNIELGSNNDNAFSLSIDEVSRLSGFQSVLLGPPNGGNISILAPVTFNVPVQLDPGSGNILLNANLFSTSQNIILGNTILGANVQVSTGSGTGNIIFNGTVNSETDGAYGLILASDRGTIRLGNTVGALGNRLRSFQIDNAAQVLLTGGINITSGDLAISQLLTLTGGDTTLSTTSGNITLMGNLTSQTGTISNLRLSAPIGNITTTNLDTSSVTTAGGSITLSSPIGNVITGDLTSKGNTDGGNVSVFAFDRIQTGRIDTSSNTGNAGNVFLDPLNDIQVTSINAQALGGGAGGNVSIFTQKFFRATGSFIDQTGQAASISTVDGANGGSILIVHDGGSRLTTFDVGAGVAIGSGGINGTVSALRTSVGNSIEPLRFFPGPYRQGNIGIVTAPQFEQALGGLDPKGKIPETLNGDRKEQGFGIDRYFTNKLEEYLNNQTKRSVTLIKSLDEIQNNLREIEKDTGIRPALIYAVFLDNSIRSDQILYRFPQIVSSKSNDVLNLVLVTGKTQPIIYKIPEVTREEVKKVISTFEGEIKSRGQRENIDFSNKKDAFGRMFYRWLVKRLAPDLNKYEIKNLTFILDDALRSIPLAAMFDEQGRSLLYSYSMGLMPSFSITDTRYNPKFKESKILAMGRENFSSLPSPMNSLPAVPLELELVTRHLGKGVVFRDQDFTVDNLLIKRGSAQIVHFGTHASFIPGQLEDSFIVFGNGKWMLSRMNEFKFYNPLVELLVLSACQTAIGDPTAELGFAGLSAEAGVRTSLGSLWKVDDYATMSLMAEFYRQLEISPIKAEALRRAQIAMMSGKVYFKDRNLVYDGGIVPLIGQSNATIDRTFREPYFWSAFTLIGSPW